MTASQIGRHLKISRQAAGKIVGHLRDCGYVVTSPATKGGRERFITLTPRGVEYLQTLEVAARRIESDVLERLPGFLDYLGEVLDSLGVNDDQPRLRDYLRADVPR